MPPEAVSGFEYATPDVAPDKDVVVRLSGGGATDRVNDLDAVSFGEEESDTCTVKVNCPDWLGVPASDPVDCKVIPAGSVPEVMVKL